MTPVEELSVLLRPAGGGVHLVSTGKAEQEALQTVLYGATSREQVRSKHEAALTRLASAKAFVLAIPSDTGAGYRRGANLGPQAIRSGLLRALPEFPARARELGIVDIGDVFVVPQLLSDEMLHPRQIEKTQDAIYGHVEEPLRRALPVSPLSVAERVMDLALSLNPTLVPIVLGGDHSTAWPIVRSLARHRSDRWGIVQPDAHTDLLPHRLGVDICFATWSWHANELFGRDGRLVQVGTRASQHDRGHWEASCNVRQFWAQQCVARPTETIDEIIAHLAATNVSGVYLSNDIDGTDSAFADATGTPEPNGLPPAFLLELIARLGETTGLIGGDVMEVAPCLRDQPDRTIETAVSYLRATLSAALKTKV